MTFDIYGQPLRFGHCEVHPDVGHDYPCPLCLSDLDQRNRERAEEAAYWEAMARAEWYDVYAQLLEEGCLEGLA